jgi:hypothetical protein
MRTLARLLAPALLTAAATAADPLAEVALAPADQLVRHFEASIYGKLWTDKSLEPVRQLLDQWRQTMRDEHKADPWLVFTACRGVGLRLAELPAGKDATGEPQFAAVAEFGDQAAGAMTLLQLMTDLPEMKLPGADAAIGDDASRFARFGTRIRFAAGMADFPVWRPETGDDDLAARVDLHGLMRVALTAGGEQPAEAAPLLARIADLSIRARLDEGGLMARMHCVWPSSGFRPVTRDDLAGIPAEAMDVTAIGFDAAEWWKDFGPTILALAGRDSDGGATGAEHEADSALEDAGLPPLKETISALSGTSVVFVTPGTPMPGYSLLLTRTPALDKIAAALVAKLGVEMPAEGTALALPLPRFPVVPQLVVEKGRMLLTSDAGLAATWPGHGWNETAAGKAALAHLDEHTVVISGSDTPAQIRMAAGLANLMIAQLPMLTPQQKQAIVGGLTRLSTLASADWYALRTGKDQLDAEGRGGANVGGIGAIAIVAAIAIPNLLESRVAAQESAAAAALKSGLLPAEVQFQNGGYLDEDGNGIGEYGFFDEMSGQVEAAPGITLNLLAPSFHGANPVISGYRYAIFLPEAKDKARADPAPDKPKPDPASASLRERRWIAYAWPVDRKQGRRIFAIDQSGNVYTTVWDGKVPEWNALYGGKTWEDPPVWPPYRRRR